MKIKKIKTNSQLRLNGISLPIKIQPLAPNGTPPKIRKLRHSSASIPRAAPPAPPLLLLPFLLTSQRPPPPSFFPNSSSPILLRSTMSTAGVGVAGGVGYSTLTSADDLFPSSRSRRTYAVAWLRPGHLNVGVALIDAYVRSLPIYADLGGSGFAYHDLMAKPGGKSGKASLWPEQQRDAGLDRSGSAGGMGEKERLVLEKKMEKWRSEMPATEVKEREAAKEERRGGLGRCLASVLLGRTPMRSTRPATATQVVAGVAAADAGESGGFILRN